MESKKTSIRFGVLLSILGFGVVLVNTIALVFVKESIEKAPSNALFLNIIILILSLIILATSFTRIGPLIQVISFIITGLITFFYDPTNGIATLQFILVFMLAYKYGFLREKLPAKIMLFSILILITFIISVNISNMKLVSYIQTLFFLSFFVLSTFLILKEEIFKMAESEKKMKKEIRELKQSLEQVKHNTKDTNSDFIDPVKAGLTNVEIILIKNLCLYRESNKDLADRLGKSPNTIKGQLTKIMNKIGCEDRHQLIDLCKNYFTYIGLSK